MDYENYIVIKFFVLVGIVAIVNFLYSAFTGKSLTQVRNDRERERQSAQDRESTSRPDQPK